ncbi:MAG: PHP domain-containing protein [Candidatus Omnitrophica bacterium]|nr:PHP domain-containing protein [Candidatus Omnitrophota bacterium]
MSKFADLHIHSDFSDSDLSLEEIFKRAKELSLSCIAITDHDTTDGLDIAKKLGITFNIELIEGIEITANKDGVEIHILGYMIDYHQALFIEALEQIKQVRKERLLKTISKLISLGVDIDSEDFFSNYKNVMPTRLHLALYMVEKNYVHSIWDAFKKFFSYGKPAYIPHFRYRVEEVISMIKSVGGLAFLAHPHYLPNREWIREFVEQGLDGIEVIYPRYSQEQIDYFKNLADSYNLLKSGGSDAHGSYKDFTSIGQFKVPYEWVEVMKDEQRHFLYKENI